MSQRIQTELDAERARADAAEQTADSLARALLCELALRELRREAVLQHPHDLYLQTVVVLGYDPLGHVSQKLTAERFS